MAGRPSPPGEDPVVDPAISILERTTGLPGPPDQVRWRAARVLRPGHRQWRLV